MFDSNGLLKMVPLAPFIPLNHFTEYGIIVNTWSQYLPVSPYLINSFCLQNLKFLKPQRYYSAHPSIALNSYWGISLNSFKAWSTKPLSANPVIIEFHETMFLWGISLNSLRDSSTSALCAYLATIVVHETISPWCILSNSSRAFSITSHFAYMSTRALITKKLDSYPHLIICWCISRPWVRDGRLAQARRT